VRTVHQTYAEYPLIIFSKDGKKEKEKEIARVTADGNGNCRPAPIFSMCKTADANISAPSRNGSRLSRIRPSASIWMLAPAFAMLDHFEIQT
jgi:hypothetical protein